ncbi:MAG: hypothetical protein HC897_16490 [Thermoanaerobaculia bacterium]|nr:hypothetical protein [Thermoanaerobaculia bacterium]
MVRGRPGRSRADPAQTGRRENDRVGEERQEHPAAAGQALKGKQREDFQWAAELATILIRANPSDLAARKIKAEAFRKLGARAQNPNWSDWFFTAAMELENKPGSCFLPFVPGGLVSPVIQAAVPFGSWIEAWSWHVDGQRAAADKVRMSLGLWIEPAKQDFGSEGYVLQLRHGIVEVTAWNGTKADWLSKVDVAFQMPQHVLDEAILANAIKPGQLGAVLDKVTWLKGTQEEAQRFSQYFDTLPACEPRSPCRGAERCGRLRLSTYAAVPEERPAPRSVRAAA